MYISIYLFEGFHRVDLQPRNLNYFGYYISLDKIDRFHSMYAEFGLGLMKTD